MEQLYKLENLKYEYLWNGKAVSVLNGISLTIPKKTFSCFVGPSGTGKTTLLNLLGLVDKPSSGSLLLDSLDISNISESVGEKIRLEKIGFIFQSFYLIPTLSVLENTTYFLPQLGKSKKESQELGEEILHRLGLADHLAKMPSELSGGQRQRVAIARAIVKKPMVVLADEPTANLDSHTAEKIISTFKELQQEQGTSFIFSTHDPNLVQYSDRVYTMKDGLVTSESGT